MFDKDEEIVLSIMLLKEWNNYKVDKRNCDRIIQATLYEQNYVLENHPLNYFRYLS